MPVTWPRCAVASLFSHAAGIVGFIGFEKIVVARIVSTSSPGEIISFSNLLLYTSSSDAVLGCNHARRILMACITVYSFYSCRYL